MKKRITRRDFLLKTTGIGIGCGLIYGGASASFLIGSIDIQQSPMILFLKKGDKQLFTDNLMIAQSQGVIRKIHPAKKLEHPVLEADMPWEQGDDYNGKRDRRIYIYGTVMRDDETGKFRMWYNRLKNNYYAVSDDGIHWQRPDLGQLGENNLIQLFNFHSPSIIFDKFETDPSRRYKAVGSVKGGIDEKEIRSLKHRFNNFEWYTGNSAYCAACSGDGINWTLYTPPILLSGDTVTFSQDPVTGEFLVFHKISRDPRVTGRQVFLSVSKDMQNWSDPEPVMVTDETDHRSAQSLKGGTHSEFYNMSAFPYGNQWLGLVTHFRRTGEPLIKGPGQSSSEGPIDVQLVHSRDGRKWERCSDRSPVIGLGPYHYDSGSILGVCNSPVIVGDEMWMYYTAMTTTHGGYLPDKELSIARAAWRLDGMVSMQAGNETGSIETVSLQTEGEKLYVNADMKNGELKTEVLDVNGNIIRGYEKNECIALNGDSIKQRITWNKQDLLPCNKPVSLRFYLSKGDLYSFTVE